jgi:hypothetical protein
LYLGRTTRPPQACANPGAGLKHFLAPCQAMPAAPAPITIQSSTMDDLTLRFAPPGASKYTPKNPDLLDCDQVAYELGFSKRTLERALAAPGSKVPRPFQRGPGKKRLWMRSDVVAYRTAMAFLSRTPR